MALENDELIKNFSSFIKNEREKKGYSQEELGHKIYGVINDAKQRVSKIESGKKNFTLLTMKKYLDALDCTIEFISRN